MIGGAVSHKRRAGHVVFLLAVVTGLSATKMPATRSYETIMQEFAVKLERLEDEWARVQHKRMKHKKESVRKKMKERMDIILKVNLKLQTCQQSLQAIHLVHGNSVERQRMKEEMEARFIDVDKLLDHFSQF